MNKILVLLATAIGCYAASDVRCIVKPESLGSDPLVGPTKTIGRWQFSAQNYSDHAITITKEMVALTVPQLHTVSPARANYIVNNANYNSKTSRALRLLDVLSIPIMAVTGGGLISVSREGLGAIGVGLLVLNKKQSQLQSNQPNLQDFLLQAIPDNVTLSAFGQPGSGFSIEVPAGLMHNADTLGPYQIYVPDTAPLPVFVPPAGVGSFSVPQPSPALAKPSANAQTMIVCPPGGGSCDVFQKIDTVSHDEAANRVAAGALTANLDYQPRWEVAMEMWKRPVEIGD